VPGGVQRLLDAFKIETVGMCAWHSTTRRLQDRGQSRA
jgi:hypothetical protein